jgi:hypothetical protein
MKMISCGSAPASVVSEILDPAAIVDGSPLYA